jgi:ubiquinone/menaquinone biosynthesis C-methylase UbiE
MLADRVALMHGAIYHALYDRPLASARRVVADIVPKGSTVLDVGCGTGELCLELAERKGCWVLGIDRSPRMIEFAQKRNTNRDVHFMLADATDLAGLEPGSFDYATVMFLLHEVPLHDRMHALTQVLRVAKKVIAVDSRVPLPWNFHGIALRLAEATAGPAHFRAFLNYLTAGGMTSVLADRRLGDTVTRRSVFWHDCREMVVLEGHSGEPAGPMAPP